MHACSIKGLRPASLRLIDNLQFKFGIALKPVADSKWKEMMDQIKKYYLLNIRKFNPHEMSIATIVYEGNREEVAVQQSQVMRLGKQFQGLSAGPENGQRGYFLTYMIAYIRDLVMEHNMLAESFETSVPWDCLENMIKGVTARIEKSCYSRGVRQKPFVSFRITQIYDTGCCVYVYFGFLSVGLKDPVNVYNEVEDEARETLLAAGGSLSHHHGVGKIRKKFIRGAIGEFSIEMLRKIKQQIDPNNIFGANNLI